jgi:homoserine kinase type II
VGEQLGRLHELASAFPGERANPYGPARVRGWIEALRATDDAEIRAALPVMEEELALAAALPAAPRGLVHGDLFVENVLWIGDRIGTVLDWEMCCVDAFAWDLGVAVNAWCWVEGRHDAVRARALLDGYRARRRLDPETAGALPAHARFAALRFAVSRIHGFQLAGVGPDRLAWKDWRTYRDRLLALRALGDGGVRERLGL